VQADGACKEGSGEFLVLACASGWCFLFAHSDRGGYQEDGQVDDALLRWAGSVGGDDAVELAGFGVGERETAE